MKAFQILLLLTILLVGCDDGDGEFVFLTSTYLPLEVGNSWTFRLEGESDLWAMKRVVVGKSIINGHEYFATKTFFNMAREPYVSDTVFYRIDDNGFVFVYARLIADNEYNLYRMKSQDGETWSYALRDYDVDVAVTKSREQLGQNSVLVKSFHTDIIKLKDDEFTFSLAQGIGFYAEHSDAWGYGYVLDSSTINGVETRY